MRVNETFLRWTGHAREALVGVRRFQDLLTGGGRIYHETHYAPLLRMQGEVREIALDIVRADGSRMPALVNATLKLDAAGEPRLVRTTVFDATERRATSASCSRRATGSARRASGPTGCSTRPRSRRGDRRAGDRAGAARPATAMFGAGRGGVAVRTPTRALVVLAVPAAAAG